MINSTLNGMPANADVAKRGIAHEILAHYHDFSVIASVLPNGNAFMLEPFTRQKNLTTANLGFHDYFCFSVSVSSRHDTAAIAVSMYTENHNGTSLIGVWVGALNLEVYNELL